MHVDRGIEEKNGPFAVSSLFLSSSTVKQPLREGEIQNPKKVFQNFDFRENLCFENIQITVGSINTIYGFFCTVNRKTP
jgi:hypothetical protein